MSTANSQLSPSRGRIDSALDAPLPYVAQALLRVISEALSMPEPEFDPSDEDAYLTAVARRMDAMRELLAGTISDPSMKNAARSLDEMNKWLTAQTLTYRPLEHDDEMVTVSKELEPSTV